MHIVVLRPAVVGILVLVAPLPLSTPVPSPTIGTQGTGGWVGSGYQPDGVAGILVGTCGGTEQSQGLKGQLRGTRCTPGGKGGAGRVLRFQRVPLVEAVGGDWHQVELRRSAGRAVGLGRGARGAQGQGRLPGTTGSVLVHAGVGSV